MKKYGNFKKINFRFATGLIIIILNVLSLNFNAVNASSPTSGTYTLDLEGYFYRTQDAFLPTLTITDLGLSNPGGLAAKGDTVYIADTGNQRVVIYDIILDKTEILKHEEFSSPVGVHVTSEGDIYVADSRAGAVFMFSEDLEFVRDFKRPVDPAYGNHLSYSPMQVGVDRRGSLYIVSEGLGDGVIQLNNNGEFLGFFTSNKTQISFLEKLQDVIFTDEIKQKLFPRLPPIFSAIYVKEETGLVYTTAFNSPGNAVKKHNIAGTNMLGNIVDLKENPVAITVDAAGTIYVGYRRGTIAVFTGEGKLLFRFGADSGRTDISGLFNRLSGLCVDVRGNIWAVDFEKGFLQRFTPADYALDIQKALEEYNLGFYDSAKETWKSVLIRNEMSILAHSGLAQVHMLQQNYNDASVEYALAGDRSSYSQAYWEVRNQFLQKHAGKFIIAILILVCLNFTYKILKKRTKIFKKSDKLFARFEKYRFYLDFIWLKKVFVNPVDAFYEIKNKRRGSVLVSSIIIVLGFFALVYDGIGRGFIFQTRQILAENLMLFTAAYFFLVTLFVVGNTLVASIQDGNGKIKDVYIMTGYALVPLTIFLPVATLISNVLTHNESFIFILLRFVGFAWTFVTISIAVSETHEYMYRNSIKNLLLTSFFMVISFISIAILIILGSRLIDFVMSTVKEVLLRVV